jgi:hypothetical protein
MSYESTLRMERERRRMKKDPIFRIKEKSRKRLVHAIRGRGRGSSHTVALLSCTYLQFKLSFEKKFTEGMNWQNYGEWHVDHIKPCSLFDLTDPNQMTECYHYSNLQPLWAKDNIKKSNKYEEDIPNNNS